MLSGGPFDGWLVSNTAHDAVTVDDTVYRKTAAERDGRVVYEADPGDEVKYR